MHHMIASFPGLCAGGHERGNEADHMISFKKSVADRAYTSI